MHSIRSLKRVGLTKGICVAWPHAHLSRHMLHSAPARRPVSTAHPHRDGSDPRNPRPLRDRQNPYPDRKGHALNVLSLASHYVPTSSEVVERAKAYVATGIARLDALHLALAVEGRAAYFCTTDDDLMRRGKQADTKETSVVSPLELVARLVQR